MKGVPYVLVGGQSFFDRKEVRDVMAYLRLVANPLDEMSLLRIVNCPPRGVGKATIQRALEFATAQGISAAEAFERAEEAQLPAKAGSTVRDLLGRLRALRGLFPDGKRQLVPLVQRLVEEVAYRDEVHRCYPDDAERKKRWEGVEEVLNFAENHARKKRAPTLLGFLNELTLTANDTVDGDDAARRLAVTLMTLHASKGLEFERVFLVGLEEGLLPHTRAAEEDTIEEERRLAYVGITRARRVLKLTWAAERARGGQKLQRHPSRFLLELQDKAPPADWVPAGAQPAARAPGRKRRRRRAARR
jgi:DNA helicase-2/ATP-dependent DNA helicase PcrA